LLAAALLDMGADLGQGQQVDFVEELFEATMFLNPCLDILDKVFGDEDGTGLLAGFFAGDMLRTMLGAAVIAGAGRFATADFEGHERGCQDGCGGSDFFEATVEHALNESRMLGDSHGILRGKMTRRIQTY
jgi:hypothetical protein